MKNVPVSGCDTPGSAQRSTSPRSGSRMISVVQQAASLPLKDQGTGGGGNSCRLDEQVGPAHGTWRSEPPRVSSTTRAAVSLNIAEPENASSAEGARAPR